MSRYIDADAFMQDINNSIAEMTEVGIMVDGDYLWAKMNDALENAPSIDIVRCKECKHRVVEEQSWGEYNEYCDLWCDGNGYWASVNPDDFCSYGERSEK